LTERILEDDASYYETVVMATTSVSSSSESPPSLPQNSLNSQVVVDGNGELCEGGLSNEVRNERDIPTRVRFVEEEQPQYPWWQESNGIGDRQQVQDDPKSNQHQITMNALSQSSRPYTSFTTPRTQNATQQRTQIEEGKEQDKHEPQDNAMRILREISLSLGLSPDNVGAVLPTVRRMVTVVKIHVPRLENFVESVCQIVEADNSNNGGDNCGDVQVNEQENTFEVVGKNKLQRQNLKKKIKKKGKKTKNMEARRRRMAKAVMMLNEEWPKRNTTDAFHANNISPTDTLNRRMSLTSSFCQVVIEKLNQRHQRQVAQTIDKVLESTSLNMSGVASPPTSNVNESNRIKDALESIDELIAFEERCHRIETIQKIVTDSSHPFESSPSSAFSPQSPANSEDIIEELLAEDVTTLRKVVLHFAYLFSVRQDEMRLKMNELYHFSHEAGSLINTVRKAIGVDVTCPLSTVSRRVVDAVHGECSHCGSVALPNRFSCSRNVH